MTTQIQRGKKLAEGKTKIIWSVHGQLDQVIIESKDDITAGDGARRHVLESKAVLANTTTCRIFEYLNRRHIPTHYIDQVDERSFLAWGAAMIPIEVVIRQIATGSVLKREPDLKEGHCFDSLRVEFFAKDDANHDPLMVLDPVSERVFYFEAKRPLVEGLIKTTPTANLDWFPRRDCLKLPEMAKRVFVLLEIAWRAFGIVLVDLKLEFGLTFDGELVLGDVIDNDSWRIWPEGDPTRMLDKQVYRNLTDVTPEALAQVKENYALVAQLTSQFDRL